MPTKTLKRVADEMDDLSMPGAQYLAGAELKLGIPSAPPAPFSGAGRCPARRPRPDQAGFSRPKLGSASQGCAGGADQHANPVSMRPIGPLCSATPCSYFGLLFDPSRTTKNTSAELLPNGHLKVQLDAGRHRTDTLSMLGSASRAQLISWGEVRPPPIDRALQNLR